MLTKVDHWLRERYLLQTHLYTLRLPEGLPSGVQASELPESVTRRYRFRIVSNTNELTDKTIQVLNDQGLMFATQVIERKTWLKPIIAPKSGSVVLTLFWLVSFFGVTVGVMKLAHQLKNDPVFIENFNGAVEVFKGNS